MELIPFVLVVIVIAGCLFGILIMEGLIDLEFAWLDGRRAAQARARAGFPGHIFLRNYKRIHRDRIQKAIRSGSLVNNTRISDEAFDSTGHKLPAKIAVYASSNEVAELFFNNYSVVKAREKHLPAIQHA